MSQRVEFVFLENSNEKFRLGFELLENDFSRRWLAALLDVLEKPEPLIWSNTGALFIDEQHQRTEIEALTKDVLNTAGAEVRTQPLRRFSTAEDLRPIRESCLAIVKNHPLDSVEHIEIRGAASRVVNAIANYESLYAPDHHFHGDFSFKTETRYFLAARDFLRFTPDRVDGWLYLDYAQAGLTPIAAYLQKSKVSPKSQNSFNPTAQVLYRDTFSYDDEEKSEMRRWISTALRRRSTSSRLAIGQIPLARPIHSLSRDEVLDHLLKFRGSVKIEAFENDQRLTAASLVVREDFKRLKPFHPYGAGLVGDCINALVLFGRILIAVWGERWRLLIPFHAARPYAWAFWFRLTWPGRKLFYFARHVFFRSLGLLVRFGFFLKAIWDKKWQLTVPFHQMRPHLWAIWFKLIWPFRKAVYFTRHAYRKYILRKSD